MSRNKDFTCDQCGAQFDEDDNGFTFSLSEKKTQKELGVTGCGGFKYDLCFSCASKVKSKIGKFLTFSTNRDDEK